MATAIDLAHTTNGFGQQFRFWSCDEAAKDLHASSRVRPQTVDQGLLNQHGVILLNPAKQPNVFRDRAGLAQPVAKGRRHG